MGRPIEATDGIGGHQGRELLRGVQTVAGQLWNDVSERNNIF